MEIGPFSAVAPYPSKQALRDPHFQVQHHFHSIYLLFDLPHSNVVLVGGNIKVRVALAGQYGVTFGVLHPPSDIKLVAVEDNVVVRALQSDSNFLKNVLFDLDIFKN